MHGKRILAGGALLGLALSIQAANLDTIGITALRNADATLIGAGVRVAQPEGSAPTWQVNPAAVGQPVSLFTWISGGGSSTTFPNALGQESGHANLVGLNYYSANGSPAPGVASVDNYEANHFVNVIVNSSTAIRARVVSQSFVLGSGPNASFVETQYDNYVVAHNKIIASGAGNDGVPLPPSTAYNVISVAAFGGLTAVGPTASGRAKPDLTAPAEVTSYSTPQVAGIAAILHQAGARDEAGAGTAATATNAQTIRALLMNGAVKPPGWTNGMTAPLDGRYGAGIVNAYNAWLQLRGGKRAYIESTAPSEGGDHLPGGNANNVSVSRGWDFNSLTTTPLNDAVNHYYFNLDAATAGRFSLTATLIWHRRMNQSTPYNLELFLYNTANNSLVASSQSSGDNVEHLFIPSLSAGRYDLQVLKRGGLGLANSENYALAFDFQPAKLTLTRNGNSLQIKWPVSASGFILQSTTSTTLTNGWSAVPATPGQTNGLNVVSITPNNNQQFFRLARP